MILVQLLTVIVCLGMASGVAAAPTVIGTPVAADTGAVEGTSLTFAATCPNTGTNRVAIACLNILRSVTITITSYTWNGVAMTPLGNADNVTNFPYAALYILKNPTCDGASHNAVITLSGDDHMIAGHIMFLQDVDQTTSTGTVATAIGSTAPITVGATSATGDLVVDCVASKNSNIDIVKDASQTLASFEQTTNGTASSNIESGMSYEAGAAGTTTMSWSPTPVGWAQAAVAVKPVAGVSGRRRGGQPYRLLKLPTWPFFFGALD